MRTLLGMVLLVAFVSVPAWAQRNIDWDKVQVTTQQLDENVYVLQFMGPAGAAGNAGGNVGAFIGADDISKAYISTVVTPILMRSISSPVAKWCKPEMTS